MKTLLLLTVLLSGVLAVSAAAVKPAEAVEPAEAASQELHVKDEPVKDVIPEAPEEGESEMSPAGEKAASSGGRFFTCPSGWVRYRNGCYLYVRSVTTWRAAAAHCNTLGASLASVHDVFEYSFLQDITRQAGNTIAWIGGFHFQDWRWLDQSSFNYNYWYTLHSTSGNALCLRLNSRAGWGFCNHNCNSGWPSICMKRTDTC